MKRRVGSSIASTVPSLSARPVTRRPSPIRGDALVVVALDRDRLVAGGDGGEAVRLDVDAVVGEAAAGAAVDVVLEPVGQVLLERAAVGDVDDLHAAADAEARAGRARPRARTSMSSKASRSAEVGAVSGCGSAP